MSQLFYHELALAITDMSRCAADELEREETIYQKVLQQRDMAADVLQRQLPAALRNIWDSYQMHAQRCRFMEQELQFFKGYCSYPALAERFRENAVSRRKLQQELLNKFR